MIPKELLDAIKTFQNNGFDTTNIKKAVLRKAELELGSKPIKKEKPKVVDQKTDDQLIAEHIKDKGVTTKRKGKAKYFDGVAFKDYDSDILGKKEIGSKVKLPFNDLTIDVVLIMIERGWLSCRQITEFNFGKENFDNSYDKEVRIEIYKLEDRQFIDKRIEGINRHFYKLNTRGLEFINKKTGGR